LEIVIMIILLHLIVAAKRVDLEFLHL
jgi:hypothetical protein